MRFSGDTRKHAKAQLFAWEAYEKGVDVHLLAEPTKLELLQKEYEGKKEDYKTKAQASVLAKYGGEEHLHVPPKALLLAQTETYVEYSRHGRVIKVSPFLSFHSGIFNDVHAVCTMNININCLVTRVKTNPLFALVMRRTSISTITPVFGDRFGEQDNGDTSAVTPSLR